MPSKDGAAGPTEHNFEISGIEISDLDLGSFVLSEPTHTLTVRLDGVPCWPETVNKRLDTLENTLHQAEARLRKLEGYRWTEEELIEMEKVMPSALPVASWRFGQALEAFTGQILSAWADLLRKITTWAWTFRAKWELGNDLMDGDTAALLPNYSACTLIMPDGTTCQNKSVKTARLMTVDQALERLRGNQSAWVAPGDVEAVLGELAGKV